MTKTAEAGELAAHLSKFLDEVKAGHEVLVTRGNQPVARLVPASEKKISARKSRSTFKVRTLPGKWIGEAVIKQSDLAEEMFARE
jgi:prevent-host-death family protein